ncbi:uncharacterized protein LOC103868337 isoform X2 [Brassica rapa]|uniref:uncharacterized protein LOC103868337 isoform X2 n=1 Tax=Brassica campestris TaxID=3711 RepID=UPI00142D9C87|nr:uncharacterized protein LOC103868337 isoform X2 [Brassica rapa]
MSKELEKRLLEAGKALLLLPSSVDTLLHLLDKLFICLVEVEQSPPSSIQEALSPLKKALVDERLFKHWNVHVRVHVASCFIQVTRINAPTAPYVDEQMREVLKLIVSSFEHLDDKNSLSYTKSTSILNTVAKDDHPVEVFSDMENIMTHVLKESDDLPPKLLAPILHYVNETDEVPSISRRLAEKVLLNCSTKCQTYLAEAVKSSGVSLDKYSNVVAFICEGASSDIPKKKDDDEPQQLDSNAINSGLDEETGRAVNQKKKESSMEAKPSAATASASQEIGTAQAKLTKESGKKIASASNAKPTVPPTKRSTSEIKATKQSERPISLGDNKKTIVSSGKSVSKSKTEVMQQPSEKTLANTNAKRKHSLDTEKAFDDRKYDKTLVGSRIRVWWPLDKMYYRGEVTSYDPSRKRHMVVYEDGDQETLDLKNHNWYLVEASKSSKHKDKQKAAEVSNREQTGAPKRRPNLSLPHEEDPAEAETQARKRARVQSHSLHTSHGEMEKPTAEGEPFCHHRKPGSELGHSQTCSITHQLGKVKQSITDTITSVRKFGSEVETKEQTIVDMLTSVRQFCSQLETKEQSIVDMLTSVKQFRSELETKEQRIVDTLNSVQQFRSEIKKKEDNLVASLHEVDVLGEKISGINKILNS